VYHGAVYNNYYIGLHGVYGVLLGTRHHTGFCESAHLVSRTRWRMHEVWSQLRESTTTTTTSCFACLSLHDPESQLDSVTSSQRDTLSADSL